MNRRDFLIGLAATPFVFTGIKRDDSGEGIIVRDDESPLYPDSILWCRVEFSRREFDRNKYSMKNIEAIVDAKLSNAKETIMMLFEDHLND